MSDFRLRLWPDPILKRRCDPVEAIDDAFTLAVATMMEVYEKYDAYGIAANQVGYTKRVALARIEGKPFLLVNPVVSEPRGRRRMDESCLSLPGLVVGVTRPHAITVTHLSGGYIRHIFQVYGLEAAIVQHEIDHLDGKTLADHPAAKRTQQNREALAKLKAAAGSRA